MLREALLGVVLEDGLDAAPELEGRARPRPTPEPKFASGSDPAALKEVVSGGGMLRDMRRPCCWCMSK